MFFNDIEGSEFSFFLFCNFLKTYYLLQDACRFIFLEGQRLHSVALTVLCVNFCILTDVTCRVKESGASSGTSKPAWRKCWGAVKVCGDSKCGKVCRDTWRTNETPK